MPLTAENRKARTIDWTKPLETDTGDPVQVLCDDFVGLGGPRKCVVRVLQKGVHLLRVCQKDGTYNGLPWIRNALPKVDWSKPLRVKDRDWSVELLCNDFVGYGPYVVRLRNSGNVEDVTICREDGTCANGLQICNEVS